jgi:phytoene dehydrogenase-like protein
VGGSIAGLLAARVLADRFTTVTILERDELP